MKIFDYQIIVTIIMVICAWKWGDWKNWKLYYPTIQFYIISDFLYGLLTYNHPLWQFESTLLKVTFSDIIITFVFVPASILIFLYRFPQRGTVKKILFVLLWVAVYTITEGISYLLGFFSYHNGWTIWWSLLFNCAMFPILWLHYKKPLVAIMVLLMLTTTGIVYFKVPLSSMK